VRASEEILYTNAALKCNLYSSSSRYGESENRDVGPKRAERNLSRNVCGGSLLFFHFFLDSFFATFAPDIFFAFSQGEKKSEKKKNWKKNYIKKKKKNFSLYKNKHKTARVIREEEESERREKKPTRRKAVCS